MSPGIYDAIANYSPASFVQQQQLGAGKVQQQQQETQAMALENQVRIRQLKDQDALTKAYQSVDFTADPATQQRQIAQGMAKNGMSGTGYLQHLNQLAEYRKNLATADKTTLDNEGTVNERVSDVLATVENAKTADLPQVWAAAAPRLSQLTGRQFDPNTVPTPSQIGTERGMVTHRAALLEEAQKKQQTATSAAQERADTAKAAGEEAANVETAAQRQREQTARENPNDQQAQLAAMTSEQRANLGVKQREAQLQIDKLKEAIQRHDQLYGLERDRNQRAAEQFQMNNADIMDKTSPVYGTTPKSAVASKQAIMKADTDFDNQVASARAISDFITQVRTGGPAAKAAARLIPTQGSFVLSTTNGSHRINRQEVQANANVGDLYDHVVGGVKGVLTGVNMTDDVLNSLEALYGGLANTAAKKRADAYAAIDRAYKTNWSRNLQGGGGGGGGGRKIHWTRDEKGNPIPVGAK